MSLLTAVLLTTAAVAVIARRPAPPKAHRGPYTTLAALRSASERSTDPDIWSDYSAALFAAADAHDDADVFLDALAAADRAIELRPDHAAGHFHRAHALHRLGLLHEARREWQRAAEANPASRWADEALRRMHDIPLQSEADERREAFRRLDASPPLADVRGLVHRLPQPMRAYGELLCMSAWASAVERGDTKTAAERLGLAGAIGEELRAASGESLLAEAVAAVERAGDPRVLAEAHRLYYRGRQAHTAHRATDAERDFREAARLFAMSGSPMAFVARYYVGSALHAQLRLAESLAVLDELAGELPPGHRALRAQVGWERGLCLAAQGRPFAGLAVLTESRDAFAALRERGNDASLETIVADVYDYVGNGDAAWKARRAALRELELTGDAQRVIVALEGAAGRKVRNSEWSRAAALLNVASAMAARARDAYIAAHILALRSIIHTELAQPERAAVVLTQAREWAKSIGDARTRRQIDADIAMAAGYSLRRSDAGAAITQFDDAFRWYSETDYRVPLPRVLLERGRAQRSLQRLDAAAADFDEAIAMMEELRRAMPDALQRAAAFSSAEEIFDEAIGLALARGESERAFALAERGRARALVDAYQRDQPLMGLRELQSALAPDAAIVEYHISRDAVVTFVLTHARFDVVPLGDGEIAVRHAVLNDPRGAALHAMLFAPLVPHLRGISTIAFVPDRFLSSVSFGVLPNGPAGRRLIDDFVIVQTPSANLAIITSRAARRTVRDSVAAIAASIPDPRRYPTLSRLDGAEREARAVAGLYRKGEVTGGPEATARAVVETLERAGTIHFAGHAIADSDHPAAARLIVADGEVTASDIAGIRLTQAPTVVLAACETARAAESRDGATSVAAAFLIAGAPVVIGSAVDLDDEGVTDVVVRLHRNLLRLGDAAEALQATLSEKPVDPQLASFTAFGGSTRLIERRKR